MHFARAAYRAGHGQPRRQLARWGVEHLRFRLRGSTDERTAQLLAQVKELLAGVPRARHRAPGARRCWRGSCRGSTRRCSRRSTRTRTRAGATFIISAAGNELVEMLARVLGMDGGIGTRYEVDATAC